MGIAEILMARTTTKRRRVSHAPKADLPPAVEEAEIPMHCSEAGTAEAEAMPMPAEGLPEPQAISAKI